MSRTQTDYNTTCAVDELDSRIQKAENPKKMIKYRIQIKVQPKGADAFKKQLEHQKLTKEQAEIWNLYKNHPKDNR